MRSADAATLFRVLLAVVVVYLVLGRFSPYIIFMIILSERVVDGLDGYLARRQASRGRLGFAMYLKGVMGNAEAKKGIAKCNAALRKIAPHGSRLDVAGDRSVEYIFWALFSYLGLVPLFVFIIVIVRHSFVDALMGSKGTSSKMKSRFANSIYASNYSRLLINVPKVLAFGYLPFVYIYGWPLYIGYLLVGILVAGILIRGAAEAYESLI
jgi:phosphatidylglycerophosphate synthase